MSCWHETKGASSRSAGQAGATLAPHGGKAQPAQHLRRSEGGPGEHSLCHWRQKLTTMHALPKRLCRLLVVTGLPVVTMFGQIPSVRPSGQPTAGAEARCSNASLRFRCLRQPPVFHRGEAIKAQLSVSTSGLPAFTAFPDTPRSHFKEIVVWEPRDGAIDPSTLDNRIRVGSGPGDHAWSEDRNREIELNEYVQFRRPGRYVLHVVLMHIVPLEMNEQNRHPWLTCELQSNAESVEILAPNARWEAAELGRIGRLLESDATRLEGARSLRYLNTPAAAATLARLYLQLPNEPANSEFATGIYESPYAGIVQKELEKALPTAGASTEKAIGTLTWIEVRRQFSKRPCPSDPEAAKAWSKEYWALFESVKNRYADARTSR